MSFKLDELLNLANEDLRNHESLKQNTKINDSKLDLASIAAKHKIKDNAGASAHRALISAGYDNAEANDIIVEIDKMVRNEFLDENPDIIDLHLTNDGYMPGDTGIDPNSEIINKMNNRLISLVDQYISEYLNDSANQTEPTNQADSANQTEPTNQADSANQAEPTNQAEPANQAESNVESVSDEQDEPSATVGEDEIMNLIEELPSDVQMRIAVSILEELQEDVMAINTSIGDELNKIPESFKKPAIKDSRRFSKKKEEILDNTCNLSSLSRLKLATKIIENRTTQK